MAYGQRYDDGPDSGYGDYQMYALDHMIIDNSFYPSSFRSGWNVMSTSLSNWVEQWFPFDYCPGSGGWSPVHAYPGMNHWQTQTLFLTYYSQVQQAFVEARDHGSSIYSFYMHQHDDMVGNITDLSNSLRTLANDQINFPGVKYEYVTAAQAMQLALGYTDVTPPTFQVSRNGSTYIINSSETLWSNNLYVAVSYNNGSYIHLAASPVGTNIWTVNVPGSSSINKIGVAANDLYGNPGISVVTPTTTPLGPIPPALTVPQTMPPEVQVSVVGVTASSYLLGFSPDKAVDGNDSSLLNYWGTAGSSGFPQWLKLDLGSVVPVNQLTTHFFDGDSRNYTYSIDVSRDGSTWTNVVAPKASRGLVTDDFAVTMARYVKINCAWQHCNFRRRRCGNKSFSAYSGSSTDSNSISISISISISVSNSYCVSISISNSYCVSISNSNSYCVSISNSNSYCVSISNSNSYCVSNSCWVIYAESYCNCFSFAKSSTHC